MKKRLTAVFAGVCAAAMVLTGCSGEVSNEYIAISQYKGVEVDKVELVEVTDAEVEEQIQLVLQSTAEYVDITDRPAKDGDTVTIDYVGKLDGVAFDGGTASDADLELGSGTFIDGFEDGVVGHEIGDEFELELTFPENYGSAELAGQDVIFEVTLKAITEVKLPELTDEWVEGVSETAKTVDEYKAELKEQMTNYYAEAMKGELETAVWEKVLENTTVNQYNTEELQKLIKNYQDQYQAMAEEYDMEFEEFLESYMSMTLDEFNSEVSTVAKEQLKETYIVDLIIEKSKLEVTDEAKMPVYEEFAEYFGFETVDQLKEAFEEAGSLESLELQARKQIVLDWLVENCKQVEAESSEE